MKFLNTKDWLYLLIEGRKSINIENIPSHTYTFSYKFYSYDAIHVRKQLTAPFLMTWLFAWKIKKSIQIFEVPIMLWNINIYVLNIKHFSFLHFHRSNSLSFRCYRSKNFFLTSMIFPCLHAYFSMCFLGCVILYILFCISEILWKYFKMNLEFIGNVVVNAYDSIWECQFHLLRTWMKRIFDEEFE